MSHLLNVSKSGLHAFQYHLDTVANDVANVNTLGYKARQAEFEELMTNNYAATDTLLLNDNVDTVAIQSGVRADDYTVDMSLGKVVASEGPDQFAIAGDGFFQVTGRDNQIYYTRDGAFTRDLAGAVVNARGERITMNGSQPAIFQPALNAGELVPVGENKYTATGAMQQVGVEVLEGFVEQSNVDLATAITDMMIAQRAYAMNVKAAQSTDEMMSGINQFKQ